jgi:hypothetical protein
MQYYNILKDIYNQQHESSAKNATRSRHQGDSAEQAKINAIKKI